MADKSSFWEEYQSWTPPPGRFLSFEERLEARREHDQRVWNKYFPNGLTESVKEALFKSIMSIKEDVLSDLEELDGLVGEAINIEKNDGG